jgi:uncharacterized membrane protein YgdD (TMEM256/DUF423 family)
VTDRTARLLFAASAVGGAVAVAAGAFGAHALRDAVSPERLEVWRTAASYGLVHAVAGAFAASRPDAWARRASGLFLAGTVVFSGSLYALVLLDAAWLGAVTPLGGLAFIAGWLALAASALHEPRG